MTVPFLVIGYGNELCGDDAVGPRAARRVAAWGRRHVRAIAVRQLAPELAAAMKDAAAVIFVDASADPSEKAVCVRRVEAAPGGRLGHTSDPRRLLALTEAAYGVRPEAWLITVPAVGFGLGARVSPAARAGLGAALGQISRLAGVRGRGPAAVAHA